MIDAFFFWTGVAVWLVIAGAVLMWVGDWLIESVLLLVDRCVEQRRLRRERVEWMRLIEEQKR